MKFQTLTFILLLHVLMVSAQKVFSDQKEYELALQHYLDAKDSYDNYLKKYKYYTNCKIPKSSTYPVDEEEWYKIFEPDLNTLGIRPDNIEVRIHPNINPSTRIYFNFIESAQSDYLSVLITTKPISSRLFKFSAKTFAFNHPGPLPVFVKREMVNKVVKSQINTETSIDTLKKQFYTIKKDPAKVEFFIMPDGNKYTIDKLIKHCPSMANKLVLAYNFRSYSIK